MLRQRGHLQSGMGNGLWPVPFVARAIFYCANRSVVDSHATAGLVLAAAVSARVIENRRDVVSVWVSQEPFALREGMEDWTGRPYGSVDMTFVGVYPWRKAGPPRWEVFE